MTTDVGLAVCVRDAYKSYGETPILSGLNMSVQESTIYGLLGPSGCGKTTLLNCIVGRSKLDFGRINVKVKSRSQMGYMPQDLALFTQFTIEETLSYYGTVYGMTKEEVAHRTEELANFLELPDIKRSLEILSGGQQRRVSLCVALLHNPSLLILDEPTVGVDPLLSHSIWQQLMHMCSSGKKTIVITTHYIEEARQAQTIGLLRNGHLLAEESPDKLMSTYQSDTLEKVFLLLSQKQSNNNHVLRKRTSVLDNFKKTKKEESNEVMSEGKKFEWCRVQGQLMKFLFWMKHNIPIMMFLLLLPVLQSTIFCLTIGLDPIGLKMGVVNQELLPGQDCPPVVHRNCSDKYLSCRYLQYLNTEKTIIMEYFDNDETARRGVEANKVWGFIHIPANYSSSLLDRVSLNIDASEDVVDYSELDIWMDMSNQYIGNLLRRDLLFGQIEYLQDLFEDCGWPRKAAGVPISFESAVYGSNKPSFGHFAAPAVVQLFEFYLPMMFTVGAILMEKRDGTLERSFVSGISLKETLLAHVIVQMILLAIQTFLMMIVLFVIFDNPLKGNLAVCLFLLFLIGVDGMCYGFFVSTLCESDSAALYMGLGSFFPLAMLSGMVWPFEGMHWSLRAVGWLLPLTLTTESFRAITARAWPLSHPTVYRGFLSAGGWIAFFILATYAIIKAQNGLKGSIKIPILKEVLKRKY